MKCGIFVSDLTVLSTLNNIYDSSCRVLSVAFLQRRTGGSSRSVCSHVPKSRNFGTLTSPRLMNDDDSFNYELLYRSIVSQLSSRTASTKLILKLMSSYHKSFSRPWADPAQSFSRP